MPIKAITFDCAQTLIEVSWNPERSLCEAASLIGITLPAQAPSVFGEVFHSRFPQFLEMNLQRSVDEGRRFYESLTAEWLKRINCDAERAAEVTLAAEHLVFGPDTRVFSLYSETVEALRGLRANNFALGVISNWDYTLHRVLEMFNLNRFFAAEVASLEEGVEKPDPKLFEIALARLGFGPEETLHVGDDPVDDVEGAENLGIRAVLLDRTQAARIPFRLNSLLQISEAIAWLD